MNVLFLHHFESFWEDKLNLSGTSIEKEKIKVVSYLKSKNFKRIIITKNKNIDFEIDYLEILEHCISKGIIFDIYKYGCGTMKKSKYNDLNYKDTWCYGKRAYHDENDILLIKKWMKKLTNDHVYLGGCFEKECILDIETIFNCISVKYTKVPQLIVS